MEKETKHTPKMRLIKNALVLRAEIDRLKEENERLKKENKVIYGSEMVQLCDYQDLKKEREELVKLMDDVRFVINITPEIKHQEPYVKLLSEMESLLSRIKK